MSHREGLLNLSTLPLVGNSRELWASVPVLIPCVKCSRSFVPPLRGPVVKVTRLLKSTWCTKWRSAPSKARGLNPFYSACYKTYFYWKKLWSKYGRKIKGMFLNCCTTSYWLAEIITTGFSIAGLSDMLSQSILGSCACKPELEKPITYIAISCNN